MSAGKCAKCEQTVYPVEALRCLDKVWHKGCFKCHECNMTLSLKNYKGFDKKPYCNAHCPQAKATTVADTPEIRRLAENSRIQSQAKYHEDFEKSKGKGFTPIADDPETLRIKNTSKIISNVAYHGELERKKQMEEKRGLSQDDLSPVAYPNNNSNINNNDNNGTRHQSKPLLHNVSPNEMPIHSVNHHSNQSQSQNQIQAHHQQQQIMKQRQQQQLQQQYKQQQMMKQQQYAQDQYMQLDSRINQQQQPNMKHIQQHFPMGHPQQQVVMRQQQQQHQLMMMQQQQQRISMDNMSRPAVKQGINSHPQQITKQHHIAGSGASGCVMPMQGQIIPPSMAQQQPMVNSHKIHPSQIITVPYGQRVMSNTQLAHPQQVHPMMQSQYNQHMISQQMMKQAHVSGGPRHIMHSNAPINQMRPNNQLPQQQQQPQHHHHQGANSRKAVRAMYDYVANDVDEVSFFENDILIECVNVDGNWLVGKVARTGQTGMLPANYVTELSN